MRYRVLAVLSILFAVGAARPASATSILVYDENTEHGFAQTAAAAFGTVTVAGAATFNALLAGGGWDIVAVDVPSTKPTGGWGDLIGYISGGGRVAMSYWDWDVDPGLTAAFGGSVTSTFSLSGTTLTDTGATGLFTGVTMPNADWHNHWADDGDRFSLLAGSVGAAQLGGVGDYVVITGNGGRTVAAFLIDEAGNTWLSDGSAVQLWENMIGSTAAVPEPGTLVLLGAGLLGLAAWRRRAT